MSVSFPKQLYHFIVPPSMHDGVDFSVSSKTLVNITFLIMSPEAQHFLNLRKPNLPFFFFFWLLVLFVSYLRKSVQPKGTKIYMLYSKTFIVIALAFRSLIHLESIFVYGVRQEPNFTLWHITIQQSLHQVLKDDSFPTEQSQHPYYISVDHKYMGRYGFIYGLSILFH